MAWYDGFFGRKVEVEEKLNPIQTYLGAGSQTSREFTDKYETYYENLEVVNRAVNMIVDDCAEITTTVGPQIPSIQSIQKGLKRSRLDILLNKEPNPFQDINTFKRNLITDLLIDGNIFIYYDGVHLYHLPANNVTIESDTETYINKYVSVSYTHLTLPTKA